MRNLIARGEGPRDEHTWAGWVVLLAIAIVVIYAYFRLRGLS
jgi:hypothetical protein